MDPTANPKTIDSELADGTTLLGIYEFKDGVFKACFALSGGARPTEFATQPGDNRILGVWKKKE